MKFTIVPEIINNQRIVFLNEKNIKINLCDSSPFRYASPFKIPFLVIDTFAKKTTAPEEIVIIDLHELRKLGFMMTRTSAGRSGWFRGQRVIYRIESQSNLSPGSKRVTGIPPYHSIQKDITNKRIRIIGPNAGWPRRGNGGPWIEIREK